MTTMDCTWPEKVSGDRKRAIDELVQGRNFTDQLRSVLGKPLGGEQQVYAQDLLVKILNSFTETLTILNSGRSDEVVSKIPASCQLYSPGWDGRKMEESGESSKSSTKDRRGCYKRRKSSQSWIKTTPNLMDDGHAWRKYGQKIILNAKYPRNYFRCTHKHDQGCMATKQVQMTEDDPPLYRTTYHGSHTCKSMVKAPQFVLDTTPRESSILLSFESTSHENSPFFSSFPLVKQEEEMPSDHEMSQMTHNHDQDHYHNHNSSSSDYLLSHDLPPFESNLGSDHGDVLSGVNSSCTDSTHSLDLDMMASVVDFQDVLLNFDDCC